MVQSHPPIPEELLLPLAEEAADTLRSLDPTDVPGSLRHLRGFDRRGLLAGPGRRQLLRVLDYEHAFRQRVVERFLDRDEVRATLASWSAEAAFEVIAAADARHDLPLLASALWAAEPEGAEFALGIVVAREEQERKTRAQAEELRAQHREIAMLEEGQRRAEVARGEAESEAARLATELQKERRSRRTREEEAIAEAQAARREIEQMIAELEAARSEVKEERARTAREAKRSHELEAELQRVRAEALEARALADTAPQLDDRDVRQLGEAATAARRVAETLSALELRARNAAPAPRRMAESGVESVSRRGAPIGRAVPVIPGGLAADSSAGIEAMLRTPEVVLVIDGYNVTKRAWPDASASDQRERLAVAVTALHRRLECRVEIVFDGDGSGVVRPELRRGGVRVLFSDAGEEADELVVRLVSQLPKRVPVVVASSDAWVRANAEAEGAVVIGADALLRAIRPER